MKVFKGYVVSETYPKLLNYRRPNILKCVKLDNI